MNPNPYQTLPLQGQVIILTGAAGLFGRGLTRHLVAAGATLILAARNAKSLELLSDEVAADGVRPAVRCFDQGNSATILELRDFALTRFGRIDGLVNNAVLRPMHSIDAPLADWETSMQVNATGIFSMTRIIGQAMAERGSGSIVHIGSIYGMVGPHLPMYEGLNMSVPPDYFFHKAGMVNLTRYFAAHYGPRGVRVNCVSPGGYYTDQDPRFVDRYKAQTFLRRMADDNDLGGPVTFLLSSHSRYVTGTNLPVDGGYTAH